jgi:hypothetical protein
MSMNAYVRGQYRMLRKLGWTAREALRTARIRNAFTDAENAGLVRIECSPEQEDLSAFEPDWEGLYPRECDQKRARKEWLEQVNRYGLWYYYSEFRTSQDDKWQRADGVGGFLGASEGGFVSSGYDADIMRAALDALDDARQREADALASRATYAGPPTV